MSFRCRDELKRFVCPSHVNKSHCIWLGRRKTAHLKILPWREIQNDQIDEDTIGSAHLHTLDVSKGLVNL